MNLQTDLSISEITVTKTKRITWLFLVLSLASTLLGACGSSPEIPITPAADRPTFLFFYTDG